VKAILALVAPALLVLIGCDQAVEPVCTGPFRFAEYVRGDRLTVVRNNDYWGDKAKLEKLTFRFIPDENTRALALRAGEVDAIFDVGRSMVAGLENSPGIKIVAAPPGGVILAYITSRGRPPGCLMPRAGRRETTASESRTGSGFRWS
jgi:peptide/nickel transport system substrate-binding protein